MKKIILLIIVFFLALNISVFVLPSRIYSDELDDLNKQISDLTAALNMSINATRPLESQLKSLQIQIKEIKNRVIVIEKDIEIKKKTIEDGYKDLEKQQKILNIAIRNYYIKSYYNSPILVFLSGQSASEITQILAYQKAKADQDKTIIMNIAISIADLEVKKNNLESEQKRLASVKASLDEQSSKLDKVVSGAKEYQTTLSTKIAQLSTRQQELLAQKLGSLNLPKSAYSMRGGCTDDRSIDPGFSPRFALFTYGVPNRIGLSQYGAWGRAKSGQDYEQILRAYYNFDAIQDTDVNTNIRVNDSNGFDSGNVIWNGSLEEYIKRIYEVPDSWADNNLATLKAQAIAARSYVLAATDKGRLSICANEYCQAFQINPKGGNWEQAVTATAGKVMVQGGNPIKAWFSSTHGGYVFSSGDIGWSSTSWTKRATDTSGVINSFSDLQNNAYDKDSPVFYCDWGSRAQYNKTAWLKPEEIADIVNVLILAKNDSSTQKHLSQTDKPNPDGVDTWDADRVRQELRSRNLTPYNSVSEISVDWDKSVGRTTSVNVSGDAGSTPFTGDEFKNYFNLRAPSNINIVGPLYNVEKR
ncbi:MAG: hypothetical protein M1524_01685 [Patescibacteria group bacterium]|nr:hypothetical protein [Patescibacteria group bacterium]